MSMMFDKKRIPDLNKVVVDALELFLKKKLPRLQLGDYKRPLVVGSGNSAVTGKIIMKERDAVFADEGNYLDKLKNIRSIDGAILISASGGKHAPVIAKELRKRKIETILMTNNSEALASKFVNQTFVFPKNVEPYTYNTSTYLSMIMSKTKENPKKILLKLKEITTKIPRNFKKYDAYYIMVPEKFDLVREMFVTKFDELFGPMISGRVFTLEQTKHAKTVVQSKKEFFVGLGYENKMFGKHRLNVSLSKNADFGEMIAVGYYIIGYIQNQNKSYFKDNILEYTKKASKIFGQKISPIVK
jgi:D-arabinose 5-phosphate isomerase GutQ